jgi:hydroxysqualene synthase
MRTRSMPPVDHYENFPVASVLCPPRLRPAVVAIYHFARTADDIADEGDALAPARLATLAEYRADLTAVLAGRPAGPRWLQVFFPLARHVETFGLPGTLLHDLLDAFEQDIHNPPYRDRDALLDYCRRSANPVGRLLLHLYAVNDAASLRRSDAICTALQLINFWQDLSVDGPRGRHYVPQQDAARHGVQLAELANGTDSPRSRALVAELNAWARDLMLDGAPLATTLPGRAGWELRLVVQGGLRIAHKIERLGHATLARRPKLRAWDVPPMLWHALTMRTPHRRDEAAA